MEITEYKNWTGESYQIIIELEDNLNPIEIGECFTKQYPKEKVVIVFKKIMQIKIGILIVGLKLKQKKHK